MPVAQCTAATCTCAMDCMWEDRKCRFAVYPRSKLLLWKGLLFRYQPVLGVVFGVHHATAHVVPPPSTRTCTRFCNTTTTTGKWSFVCKSVKALPAHGIRMLQRWLRRIWGRRRAVALMMGAHKRLGTESPLLALDPEVLRLIALH